MVLRHCERPYHDGHLQQSQERQHEQNDADELNVTTQVLEDYRRTITPA